MITVAIVEDEDTQAQTLKDFLHRFEADNTGVQFNIDIFNDGLAFLDGYQRTDLIFMDIEMPMLNGMDTAERLRKIDNQAVIIFVTNMAQYAIKGYSVNALDFMVKPIAFSDFSFKLKRALNVIAATQSDNDVVVELRDGIRRMKLNDIHYLEVHGHTLTYHLGDDSFDIRGTLTEAATHFNTFLKCNSCYLINPKHIDWVKGYEVKVGDDILAISRPRKKDFLKELSDYYSKGGM